jgi:hypothetical protein
LEGVGISNVEHLSSTDPGLAYCFCTVICLGSEVACSSVNSEC